MSRASAMLPDRNVPLSLDHISLCLAPFTAGIELSIGQLEQIKNYVELLLVWNRSMNLTAVEDRREIVARHFGESLLAAFAVPIRKGRLADVGTGAGFPGLPLKIVCPELDLVLLEPNHKKCAFLHEIVRELGLEHVEVRRSRFEEYALDSDPRFDFVCSRALGDYNRLLRWAKTVLARDGKVVFWLGEEDSVRVGKTPGWSWDLPIRIPESARRVIQLGRPATS